MKRVKWLPLFMLLAAGGVRAQALIGVTVSLTQVGPNFLVDGQTYSGSQTFFWPVGSKHILQFPFSVDFVGDTLPYQSGNGNTVEWSFGGWSDNLGILVPSSFPAQTITVQPGLTSIIGQRQHSAPAHALSFPPAPASGGTNDQLFSGAPGPPSAINSTGPNPLGWGLSATSTVNLHFGLPITLFVSGRAANPERISIPRLRFW